MELAPRWALAGVVALGSLALSAVLGGCQTRPSEDELQWAAITSNTQRILMLESDGSGHGDGLDMGHATESVPTYASTELLTIPSGGEADLTIMLDSATGGEQTFFFYYSSFGVVCAPTHVTVDTGGSTSFVARIRACPNAQSGGTTWLTCKNASGLGSVMVEVRIK